jgi:colicin import membrane protein
MKTRSMVVLALAALLVLGGAIALPPASRIAAQQSGAADQEADRVKRLEEARQQAEKAKAAAAELRERLEKERNRAEQAEREVRAQRDAAQQAEAEARRRAQQALAAEQAARQEADKARQDAERARYAAEVRAAQEAFAKGNELAGKGRSKQLLQELEREKAALLTRLQAQRVALMTQLKHLDEEQQRVLEEFAKQAASVSGKAEPGSALPHPDRLDQILERLERIEGRLRRLEKQQPTAPKEGQR